MIHETFEERMRRRNCPLWESPLRTIVNADEMEPDACPTNTVGENSGSKLAADVSRIDRREDSVGESESSNRLDKVGGRCGPVERVFYLR